MRWDNREGTRKPAIACLQDWSVMQPNRETTQACPRNYLIVLVNPLEHTMTLLKSALETTSIYS